MALPSVYADIALRTVTCPREGDGMGRSSCGHRLHRRSHLRQGQRHASHDAIRPCAATRRCPGVLDVGSRQYQPFKRMEGHLLALGSLLSASEDNLKQKELPP
jgi:hypothetical protein